MTAATDRSTRRSERRLIWRQHSLLRDYVFILANSGLRVGEANALKIRDLVPFKDELGRRNYRLLVDGKTGQREVVPRAGPAKFLERVLSRKVNAQPDDLLFAMSDGGPIVTLIDQFNAALEEAELTHSSKGEKYTLYSLRHFYAVMAYERRACSGWCCSRRGGRPRRAVWPSSWSLALLALRLPRY